MRICVVKFGGSVITNKNSAYSLHKENVGKIAKVLRSSLQNTNLKLILVFGGGSFGNVAPTDYGLFPNSSSVDEYKLAMMPVTMAKMLAEITEIMVSEYVPVFPFQCSALIYPGRSGELILNSAPLNQALVRGYIPILTGDCVFSTGAKYELLSSDNVLPLIGGSIKLSRAVYYSDVPGLYFGPLKKIVDVVEYGMLEKYSSFAGPSTQTDITGGMSNKIKQINELVELGVESELLSFSMLSEINRTVSGETLFGTVFRGRE